MAAPQDGGGLRCGFHAVQERQYPIEIAGPELRNDLNRVVGGEDQVRAESLPMSMYLPPKVEKTSLLRGLLAGLPRVPLLQGSTVPPLLRPPPPPLPLHRTCWFFFFFTTSTTSSTPAYPR